MQSRVVFESPVTIRGIIRTETDQSINTTINRVQTEGCLILELLLSPTLPKTSGKLLRSMIHNILILSKGSL